MTKIAAVTGLALTDTLLNAIHEKNPRFGSQERETEEHVFV